MVLFSLLQKAEKCDLTIDWGRRRTFIKPAGAELEKLHVSQWPEMILKKSKFRKREWKSFISKEGMSKLPGAVRQRPPARLTVGSWELF